MKLSMHLLLVAAMVIAPFTLLRFGMVGVAEVLVLLVFAAQLARGLRRAQFRHFVLTKFWLAYIGVSIIGLVVNATLLDDRTSTWGQAGFDLAAYVLVLATCYSLERLATHTTFNVERFTGDFVLWSGLAFSALYMASRVTPSLFGLPLRYYDYFVPWAENLHQVSMTLVPLPFLSIAAAASAHSAWRRVVFLALVPMTMVMAIATGSSKAYLAMYVGAFALAYSFSLSRFGRRWFVHVNLLFSAVVVTVLALTNGARIGEVLFEENDVGGVRNFLYSHAIEVGMRSPLVGRGPGPHLETTGAYLDAHQTWLTAFLQAGVPGVILLTALVLYIARRLVYHPALLAAFSTIVVYAAGGDILRRLPAWIAIFAVVYYVTPVRMARAGATQTVLAPGHMVRP